MTVAKLIEAFVADMGWEDEVEVREKYEDSGGLRVIHSKALTIENQPFHLAIDAIEEYGWIILALSPPFKVINGKFLDACMLFNFYNHYYCYGGRIVVEDDGIICYRQVIDILDAEASFKLIGNMVESGIAMYEKHFEEITAVALTKRTYESVREDIDKKTAGKDASVKEE